MRLNNASVGEVVERQLCCGCGACAYIDPVHIHIVDDSRTGRRPIVHADQEPTQARDALAVCPGVCLEHDFDSHNPDLIRELLDAWGPIQEVWEGYAADSEIRFAGSSGGAVSALALFCMERLGFHGVLHTAARPDVPYLNHTVLSTTRAEILERTGSRYAPASPCDGLQMVEEAPGLCVFIGKPCDVAAVRNACRLHPTLDEKIGLTIALFCAGTPNTRATLNLLRRLGVETAARIIDLRYRGQGWPGRFTVRFLDCAGMEKEQSLSYEESWGLLTNDKQWRCHICPDHTGEFADIAVGDPWYRSVRPGEPGTSLMLARTPRGMRLLHAANHTDYITLEHGESALLPLSQSNLLRGRAAVWGRCLALRCMGLAVPRFKGFPMFRFWLARLSLLEKARSMFGTLKRAIRKRLFQPTNVIPYQPTAVSPEQPSSVAVTSE